MKQQFSYSAALCALLTTLYQQSALAATDYLVTGNFYRDWLNVSSDVGDPIDALIYPPDVPFTPATSFTLKFSVDESVAGHTSYFNAARYFDDAVSEISLDINDSNVLTTSMLTQVQQFPGDTVQGISYPARWSWTLFPGSEEPAEALNLSSLEVLGDQDGLGFYTSLTNVNPVGIDFALYDPSQTAYGAGGEPNGELDLITLTPTELGKFPYKEFSVFWNNFDSGEGGHGGFNGSAEYTAYFTIASVTTVSAVPLPAAAWLFLSALGGLVITKRKQLKA